MQDNTLSPGSAFVEQIGLVFQAEGRPRIAGRILGLFIVEGRALSLKEIAERLQVSRASVSTNARLLAEDGLIYRAPVPGDRQDYYRLAADPYGRLLRSLERRMRRAHAAVTAAAAALTDPDARARGEELASFQAGIADTITAYIEASLRNRPMDMVLGSAGGAETPHDSERSRTGSHP